MYKKNIKETQSSTDVILDSIADGVFTVNQEWQITSFNRVGGRSKLMLGAGVSL